MENEENVDFDEVDVVDASENNIETENEQEQNTKTYSEEEVEQIKKEIHEKNQEAWNKRWGQEKSKMERNFAKQNELAEFLIKQTGSKNIDDLLTTSYNEYGVERPMNTRDEERLGKLDAQELLELDYDQIEEEANRLAGISNRTARENSTFMELGKYLTEKKAEAKRKQEFIDSGIEESVYNSDDFKTFMSQFNQDTPLKNIGEMYSKLNGSTKKKPFSAGSLKNNQIKQTADIFTPEEFEALTESDMKDDKIYEKAMRTIKHFNS